MTDEARPIADSYADIRAAAQVTVCLPQVRIGGFSPRVNRPIIELLSAGCTCCEYGLWCGFQFSFAIKGHYDPKRPPEVIL